MPCQVFVILILSILLAVVTRPTHASSDAESQLLNALASDDVDRARTALTDGLAPNIELRIDALSMSALEFSIVLQAPRVRDLLLSRGADPFIRNGSVFLYAIANSDFESVDRVLAASGGKLPDVLPVFDILADRFSPDVVAHTRNEIRERILGLPRKPRSLDEALRAWTSPVFATGDADPAIKIANLLIKAGATPAQGSQELAEAALRRAVGRGDVVLAKLLQQHGANLKSVEVDAELLVAATSARNHNGTTILLAQGVDPKRPNNQGRLALPEACKSGDPELVELLLKHGADPNEAGLHQNSPTIYAARAGSTAALEALISKGASLNVKDGLNDWALREAVRGGWPTIVTQLLDAGAKANLTDQFGRTALHDYANASLSRTEVESRSIGPSHIAAVQALKGIDFNIRDNFGRTILDTVLTGTGSIDYLLLDTFVSGGAPVIANLFDRAVQRRDRALFEWLLERRATDAPFRDWAEPMLMDLARNVRSNAPFIALLVSAGARLSIDDANLGSLIAEASAAGESELIAVLLKADLPLRAEHLTPALDGAFQSGSARGIELLMDGGANISAVDNLGDTLLHRAMKKGLASRQVPAISTLISRGMDLSIRNASGATIADLAEIVGTNKTLFLEAIAQSRVHGTRLHDAVRANAFEDVNGIIAKGEDLNAEDTLSRTALTLSLQLGRKRISDLLLRNSAHLSYVPRNSFQRADVEYASDPDLASAFRTRLLRDQLLSLNANDARNDPGRSIALFRASQSTEVPDVVWAIGLKCPGCSGEGKISGNSSGTGNFIWPFVSGRTQDQRRYWYRVIQSNITSVEFAPSFLIRGKWSDPIHTGEYLTYTVRGETTIPACWFDFATSPTCYPEVSVHNLDGPDSVLRINTPEGPLPTPLLPLSVTQNNVSTEIPPSQTRSFDRSAGPITIKAGPVSSKVMSLSLAVQLGNGPNADVPSGLDLTARMAQYARISMLNKELEHLDLSKPTNVVRSKTLATAIHIISTSLVQEKFPQILEELLRSRAKDLVAIDDRLLELNDIISTSTHLTPGEIELLIARVDGLAASMPNVQSTLRQLKDELSSAKKAAEQLGHAVRIFKDGYYTDIDRQVADFQGLVLELAQFKSVSKLAENALISPADRASINSKVRSRQVVIENGFLGNEGARLRLAFGLPDP